MSVILSAAGIYAITVLVALWANILMEDFRQDGGLLFRVFFWPVDALRGLFRSFNLWRKEGR